MLAWCNMDHLNVRIFKACFLVVVTELLLVKALPVVENGQGLKNVDQYQIHSLSRKLTDAKRAKPTGPNENASEKAKGKFRGLSEKEFKEMEKCVKQLKVKVSKGKGKKINETEISNTLLGDIAVTLNQCEKLKLKVDKKYDNNGNGNDNNNGNGNGKDNTTADEAAANDGDLDDINHVTYEATTTNIIDVVDTEISHMTTEQSIPDVVDSSPGKGNGNGKSNGNGKGRKKRKAFDFTMNAPARWNLPIHYTIDKTVFSHKHKEVINKAFSHWEQKTCLQFNEVEESFEGNMLSIQGENTGCWSYVAQSGIRVQLLNLQPQGCLDDLGIAIHEIGHAVGLYHEQARPDRERYVHILFENVKKGSEGNFLIINDSVTYGVPYDYASVMHYSKTAFAESPLLTTIKTLEPGYNFAIGQRSGTSFMDVTIVNRMYDCAQKVLGTCMQSHISCENGGYLDPGSSQDSTCKCRCPDGLGSDCTDVAHGSSGCSPVSGTINVENEEAGDQHCVTSPNYGVGAYSQGDTCSWWLKAPAERQIQMWFDTAKGFLVFYSSEEKGICMHWVEIKHKGNFTETGPRFCGSQFDLLNHNETVQSTTNQALIHFNTEYAVASSKLTGFNLCYKLAQHIITTTVAPCLENSETCTTTTTLSSYWEGVYSWWSAFWNLKWGPFNQVSSQL